MKTLCMITVTIAAMVIVAGTVHAAEIELCVQDINSCNDYALSIEPTAIPTIYKINGYEYGCPDTPRRKGRSVFGTLDLAKDTIYLSITVTGFRTADNKFFNATILYTFDYMTLQGPYEGTQSTAVDGVIRVDGSAKILYPCPPRIS